MARGAKGRGGAAAAARSSCEDAGNSVIYPQYWGYAEALGRFTLLACVGAAGRSATAASRCGVAAQHQRNKGGFLAIEPMGIGLAERAQGEARR